MHWFGGVGNSDIDLILGLTLGSDLVVYVLFVATRKCFVWTCPRRVAHHEFYFVLFCFVLFCNSSFVLVGTIQVSAYIWK